MAPLKAARNIWARWAVVVVYVSLSVFMFANLRSAANARCRSAQENRAAILAQAHALFDPVVAQGPEPGSDTTTYDEYVNRTQAFFEKYPPIHC